MEKQNSKKEGKEEILTQDLLSSQWPYQCPITRPWNFFFFFCKGVLKTQSGLQIAYLSGVDKSDAPEVHVCYNYFAVDTSNILGIYINFFLQGNSKENNTHIVDVMMMWAKRIYWHYFSIDDQSIKQLVFLFFCVFFVAVFSKRNRKHVLSVSMELQKHFSLPNVWETSEKLSKEMRRFSFS